jgi:hypothetical protein
MLERIGDVLPRFDLYISLFPNHRPLVDGVVRIYGDVIKFCLAARDVFMADAKREKNKCERVKAVLGAIYYLVYKS